MDNLEQCVIDGGLGLLDAWNVVARSDDTMIDGGRTGCFATIVADQPDGQHALLLRLFQPDQYIG